MLALPCFTGQRISAQVARPANVKLSNEGWIRVPAEFEKQRAVVVSVCDWQPHHRKILTDLVAKTNGHIDFLILYNKVAQRDSALKWIRDSKSPCDHVYFSKIQLNTIWLRDFAPILAESENGAVALDFYYYGGARPHDEAMPARWCQLADARLREVKWTVQGGNFLSNGRYCAITSSKIFDENTIQFPRPLPGQNPNAEGRRILTRDLIKQTNLGKLAILEPLQSEATKHVDIFATFVSENDVVVAQLDRRRDPVNAAILDRNAKTLGRLKNDEKPIQVHRLPIPPRQGMSWSAYTNVIFANDLLLFPVFASDPPEYVANAKRVYSKLLPDHTIEAVDITSMQQLQGALHCLSAQVPIFAKLPTNIEACSKLLN